MMEQQHSGTEFFIDGNGVADLGLIATPGAHELTALIDSHLVRWANRKGLNKETFIIPSECPRFSSGDGKGVIKNTVRGDDLYFVVDVGNYSCKYRLFGAENKNAFLIVTPLIIAGLLMALRPNRARHYVEHEVEWWTLLFFMMLFAIAGSLEEQGVTQNLAAQLSKAVQGGADAMIPFVVGISAVGSAFVDNIVFVAAFTPVIQSLVERSADFNVLWWALLFGACFGGNITMIGSTANIVALGMLEKRSHTHVGFFQWFKIGALAALLASCIAWGLLMLMSPLMPDRPALVSGGMLDGTRTFEGKNVYIEGSVPVETGDYLLADTGIASPDYAAFELRPQGAKTPVFLYVSRTSPLLAEFQSLPTENAFFRGRLYTRDSERFKPNVNALVLEEISRTKPKR